jgi:putative FmdB family regulatory protein
MRSGPAPVLDAPSRQPLKFGARPRYSGLRMHGWVYNSRLLPEMSMPIYEYRCTGCGFQDEYLQKVSEPPMTVCPSCGAESFQKLVSAAGFQLKGSGWYATDFKNRAAAKPTEAKTEAKSDAKSDSAPACGQGACAACTPN